MLHVGKRRHEVGFPVREVDGLGNAVLELQLEIGVDSDFELI